MPRVVEESHHTHVEVTVRDVRGADELRAAQELQRRAWGITEDGYILPVATMAGAQKVGGSVLGAFDAKDRLIGFAFAFLGRLNGRLVLYSQLTGVHPAHQRSGVGRALKFEQRQRARAMGLEAVVWAFDPLQASNAAFNLGVLGATCSLYEVDMYGSRSDVLNAGMATDRLMAEWHTEGTPNPHPLAWPDTVAILESKPADAAKVRVVGAARPAPIDTPHVSIEVPRSLAELKSRGSAIAAQEWQLAVREAFQRAFAAGYVAVGFSREDAYRPRYLLERTT